MYMYKLYQLALELAIYLNCSIFKIKFYFVIYHIKNELN